MGVGAGRFGSQLDECGHGRSVRELGWPSAPQAGRRRVASAVIALWLSGGALQWVDWTAPDGAPVRPALAQGPSISTGNHQEDLRQYAAISREAWQESDVVIWPESMFAGYAIELGPQTPLQLKAGDVELKAEHWIAQDAFVWPQSRPHGFAVDYEMPFLSTLQSELQQSGKAVIIGIKLRDWARDFTYNSVLAVDGDLALYHKRHLVMFGEYMPFPRALRPVWRWLGVGPKVRPGEAARPLLPVAGRWVGMSICYEAAFGQELIEALPEAAYLGHLQEKFYRDGEASTG